MITHGTADKTQAVIIILIPFQIPFSVITSHNHIRNIVHDVIIVIAVRTVCVLDKSIIVPDAKVFNKTIIQYDCTNASGKVNHLVYFVIFLCPASPSFCNSHIEGTITQSN
ncbi:hypothetical protein HOF65_05370 [bacterium]|jgi:hypothetical protein|nr:hypothetical protein [bacterium]MBT3853373.1 hypothetical protein [bacterium]MBT4633593.1 hypothetical protein [bacterium]MBT6779146.1 hypothetical protein [bacterium]